MVILLANQKGGAGKSTLAILLSNYLTIVHQQPVTVLDMDDQRSIEDHYLEAKKLENEELYEVIGSDLKHFNTMYNAVFSKTPEDIVIIDLPGKLDDDNLAVVFQKGDLIVCPFIYEKMTFRSTILFSRVVKDINPQISINFVPMRIRGTVVYDTMEQVNNELSTFGKVAPPVPEKNIFQKGLSTYEIPTRMYPDILPTLDYLYNESILPFIEEAKSKSKKGGKK